MKNESGYQHIVDTIYERAKKTQFGCGKPEQSLKMAILSSDDTPETAALTLVSAFHGKYDLVALMQAAIEMIGNWNWVNVNDRKPEIGELCWIMVRPGKPERGQFGDGLFHDKNGWICAPTHWHPLVPPVPPNAPVHMPGETTKED